MTAEGLPGRRWSVADIERMQDAGIIDRHERFELIGAEIVPMASKGVPHETVKKELNRFWTKALSPEIDLITGTTLRIGEHDFLEPDFIFWQRSIPLKDVRAEHILLLVEVADSNLSYDLGRKAQIYASLGIRDYWAINATELVTHIHRLANGDRYPDPVIVPHTGVLTPELLPALAVRLADLGLDPMSA